MSKKEQYGLEFNKSTTNGVTRYGCIMKNGIVDQYKVLQFITFLDIEKTEFLLRDINAYLNTTPNPNWEKDECMVLEDIPLSIEYPNFRIYEEPFTFPLTDIRDLLQEWLAFLQT